MRLIYFARWNHVRMEQSSNNHIIYSPMNTILQGVKAVVDQAQFVTIDTLVLKNVAMKLEITEMQHWLKALDISFGDWTPAQTLQFLFIYYALNFCFWGEPKWTIEWHAQSYDGSYGLLMALQRASSDGYPVFDMEFWQNIGLSEFSHILRGNVAIPLLSERWQIVHEVGEVLLAKYQGQAINLFASGQHSAQQILHAILQDFPSFRDISQYAGYSIGFCKRAQLFLADTWYLFDNQGAGEMYDIDTLTAFADYKIPQALRHIGILHYNESLSARVDAKQELAHNSPEEIEIRAATIWTIELLRQQLVARFPAVTTILVNDYFYLLSKRLENPQPYHRTRTTCY